MSKLDIIVFFYLASIFSQLHFFSSFITESPGIPAMDICFALSTFDLDATKTLKKMQEAVKSIIEKYKEYEQIHYSILPFGSRPVYEIGFDEQFDSLDRLMEYVMSFRRPAGPPDLVKALRRAEELFEKAPPRPRVKKFLVVFLGSKSLNDLGALSNASRPLENKAIKIISVVVGRESDPRELSKIVPNKGNLVDAKKISDDPEKLGHEVMTVVLKGGSFRSFINSLICCAEERRGSNAFTLTLPRLENFPCFGKNKIK